MRRKNNFRARMMRFRLPDGTRIVKWSAEIYDHDLKMFVHVPGGTYWSQGTATAAALMHYLTYEKKRKADADKKA